MSAKGFITYIDGVPVYADKKLAIEWAKAMGIQGYHEQEAFGFKGYVGGIDHAAAVQANTTIINPVVPKFKSKRKYSGDKMYITFDAETQSSVITTVEEIKSKSTIVMAPTPTPIQQTLQPTTPVSTTPTSQDVADSSLGSSDTGRGY